MISLTEQTMKAAPYDPENCKACPEWNDRAGQCRLPPRQRTCGSEPYRDEAQNSAGRRPHDLFARPGRI